MTRPQTIFTTPAERARLEAAYTLLAPKPAVWCAWCETELSAGVLPVSHTVCPRCWDRLMAETAA